jgi:inosine/xanthosine triphosphatase
VKALSELRLVRVGSTNPPKLQGVRAALSAFSRDITIEGIEVESGVPEQPLGFEEIVEGARNRAERAQRGGECDLGVGYEDGLVAIPGPIPGPSGSSSGSWFNIGCAAVSDGVQVSLGLSSGFSYPPACSQRAVTERRPIGALFDRFWRQHRESSPAPAQLSIGNVGELTGGALTRAEYTRHAVVCALTPFIHPDLYAGGGG